MLQEVSKKRPGQRINLVAYLDYYKQVAPWYIKPFMNKILPFITSTLNEKYNLNVININAASLGTVRNLMRNIPDLVKRGECLAISPEGLPASETIKPKRGFATLAKAAGAPVIPVTFREEKHPNGRFEHTVIFGVPIKYDAASLPGKSAKEKEEAFADLVMRSIAQHLPSNQKGIYR